MRTGVIGGLLGIGLAAALAGAAAAGTPYRAKAVCPVDGTTFEYTATASYSTWGSFLDGMPQASWTTPMPIPQCPESRFPVYREDFSDADRDKIRALVATPEYGAIRNEASYYVLWYVFDRLEPPREGLDVAWPLLQATWQVHDDPERYARYVGMVIPLMDAAMPALKTTEPENWWYFQIVLANLSRQTGDFAAATARLDALEGSPPAVGDLAQRLTLTRDLIARQDRSVQAPPRA
jgi:hypothetical protein